MHKWLYGVITKVLCEKFQNLTENFISIILMKNRKNEQKPLYNKENGLYWPWVASEAKPRRLRGVNIVRFPSYITVFVSF